MKLFAALGPGDIVAAHRAQISGEAHQETQFILSGQLLEYCREQGVETLALSYNRRVDSLHDGPLQIENRPRMFEQSSGVTYHLSRVAYALYLAERARRFGADLAIIDSGSAHYFALGSFRLPGIPVAVNFHNVLWPNGFEPKGRLARQIRALDGWFFRTIAVGTIGVAPECGKQVRQLARSAVPFFEFRAQFRSQDFQLAGHGRDQKPFRVIFVGRAERSKGILDIAAMAERITKRSSVPILFEVCGGGSALPELRQIVAEKRLTDVIHVHGRISRAELFRLYSRAHAVIVPTRGEFCEGLPAVCAEAVLSGLPIITSRLSNAIPVLGPAVIEAEPEIIESYVEAILTLAESRATYDRLSNACPELARQFLDRGRSYPAAIDRLIAHLFPNWKPLAHYEPLFARLT
jgi:glycogen(starch) synthase